MCNKRLFFNKFQNKLYWWSSLDEATIINTQTFEEVEKFRFSLADKLSITHGKILLNMSYCSKNDSIALMVNQRSIRQFSILIHRFGSSKDKKDLNFLDFAGKFRNMQRLLQ